MSEGKYHKLVELGRKKFKSKSKNKVHILKNEEDNKLINDIKNYPHAYVLCCLMDKQIKAERAWAIIPKIKRILGTFEIYKLADIKLPEYTTIFNSNKLHRFNNDMAKVFYEAIQKIKNDYDGDASKIWSDKPSSALIINRFLEFYGVGVKIATMASNILTRQFNIKFSDYYSIDVSPDIHVKRVFERTGLVGNNPKVDTIIYKARELYPKYPGVIDFSCWEIGREYCKPNNPNCECCPINSECQKILTFIKLL